MCVLSLPPLFIYPTTKSFRYTRWLTISILSFGQNKTASAVQLKHIPTGIVVKSQATRSREQNRKIARELLAAKLDILANGDQSRTAIVGSVKKKRADSAAKKARRKYRKLEEERARTEDSAGVDRRDDSAAGDQSP